jgi:hypothetical protein
MNVESGRGTLEVVARRTHAHENGKLGGQVQSQLLSAAEQHVTRVQLHAVTVGRNEMRVLLYGTANCTALRKSSLDGGGKQSSAAPCAMRHARKVAIGAKDDGGFGRSTVVVVGLVNEAVALES